MKTCSFIGCDRAMTARSLCQAHYMQGYRGEELRPLGPVRLSGRENFWQRVDKSETCWNWTGPTRHGYGYVKRQGRTQGAYRVAWEEANGPIPAGMMVDHICFNHSCVNPDHLQVVTHKQNQENRDPSNVKNTAGARGVHKNGNRWRARAKHNGRDFSAGTYSTVAEAEAAALALRNELFSNNLVDRRRTA